MPLIDDQGFLPDERMRADAEKIIDVYEAIPDPVYEAARDVLKRFSGWTFNHGHPINDLRTALGGDANGI